MRADLWRAASGRNGDEQDIGHAVRSLALADDVVGRELLYLFAPDDVECIRMAISHHASGKRSNDPIIGACWDADRLRLAWERGVEKRFFSTQAGLAFAN